MIYKNIFLSAFLVPVAIANSGANVEIKIQKLREDLIPKELDLSKIGKEIEQQEELIASMMVKVKEAMSRVLESLDEQQQKDFQQEINAFLERTNNALAIPNVKNFLIHELFSDTTINSDDIERIKSLLIRRIIEKEILKRLVRRYEEHLQVAAKIDLELTALEKLI